MSPGILTGHGPIAPVYDGIVEPSDWIYKDTPVSALTNLQSLSTGMFASMNFVTNRFTGPGRVGIQLMYLHLPTES